jgi:hypothetical protein
MAQIVDTHVGQLGPRPDAPPRLLEAGGKAALQLSGDNVRRGGMVSVRLVTFKAWTGAP